MSLGREENALVPSSISANAGQLPILLGRPNTAPSERSLPVLLGRRPNATQTLPSQLSSAGDGSEEDLVQRRRSRARFATIRPFALHGDVPDFIAPSIAPMPSILRPPRVVLSTAEGVHSMCLLRDREARLQFVRVGLPAGPLLREQDSCAMYLEQFQTGDRLQLMADCRHVFHATCIERFLRTHFPDCLARDCVSCPLCRGPVLAASISQVPQREREHVTNLSTEWLETTIANSSIDDETTPSIHSVATYGQCAQDKSAPQAHKLPMRRAGTAPLDETGCKKQAPPKRSATGPLDTLGSS